MNDAQEEAALVPADSLRGKLIYFLESGITYKDTPEERQAEAARLVDEYVHELADGLRAYAAVALSGDPEEIYGYAADMIDPEKRKEPAP